MQYSSKYVTSSPDLSDCQLATLPVETQQASPLYKGHDHIEVHHDAVP
jgi:hypothetical protein